MQIDNSLVKDMLRTLNAATLHQWIISKSAVDPLTIHETARLPWVLNQKTPIIYEKKIYQLKDKSELIVITEKKGEKKNIVSVTWNTEAKNLEKASDYGLTHSAALTTQVIEQLGAYQQIVLARAHNNLIISNKADLKEALLNLTQLRLKLLQPLERFINLNIPEDDEENVESNSLSQESNLVDHSNYRSKDKDYDPEDKNCMLLCEALKNYKKTCEKFKTLFETFAQNAEDNRTSLHRYTCYAGELINIYKPTRTLPHRYPYHTDGSLNIHDPTKSYTVIESDLKDRIKHTYNNAYLDELINRFLPEKKNLVKDSKTLAENPYDYDTIKRLASAVDDDIKKADDYLTWVQHEFQFSNQEEREILKSVVSPIGSNTIFHFIKTQCEQAIKTAQYLNQNLSYGRETKTILPNSLLRGDLNSCIENARRAINQYELDPHCPITQEHQGYFAPNNNMASPLPPKKLAFALNLKNMQAMENELSVILKITGDEWITDDQDDPMLTPSYSLNSYRNTTEHNMTDQYPLTRTRLTKWRHTGATFSFLNAIISLWNIVESITMGLTVDLFCGVLGSICGFHAPSFAQMFRINKKYGEHYKKRNVFKIFNALKIPKISLGVRASEYVVNFIKNTVFELTESIWFMLRHMPAKFFIDLREDQQLGRLGSKRKLIEKTAESILKDLRKECDQFMNEFKEAQMHLAQHDLLPKHEKDNTTSVDSSSAIDQTLKNDRTVNVNDDAATAAAKKLNAFWKQLYDLMVIHHRNEFALPAYPLSHTIEWNDMLNAGVSGVSHFIEFFTHNIHAKHPFLGVIFTMAYLIGAGAILSPHLIASILGKGLGNGYIKFSQTLAEAMSKGHVANAISSGFTQSKLATALFEFFLNGPQGLAPNIYHVLEQDSVDIILFCATAAGLTYGIIATHIPFISAYLREELGNVHGITATFAGLKFMAIIVHLIEKATKADPKFMLTKEYLSEQWKKIPECQNISKQEEKNTTQQPLAPLDHTQTNGMPQTLQEDPDHDDFLQLCLQHGAHLQHLPHAKKRTLLEYAKIHFSQNQALILSIEQALFPIKARSILGTTIHIVLDYIPLTLRCLLSVVTLNSTPFKILFFKKIPKDLTRVLRAAQILTSTIFNFLDLMVKTICDVIVNECFARIEALFNRRHYISRFACSTSRKITEILSTVKACVAEPINYCKHATQTEIITEEKGSQMHNYGFFAPRKAKEEPRNKKENLTKENPRIATQRQRPNATRPTTH